MTIYPYRDAEQQPADKGFATALIGIAVIHAHLGIAFGMSTRADQAVDNSAEHADSYRLRKRSCHRAHSVHSEYCGPPNNNADFKYRRLVNVRRISFGNMFDVLPGQTRFAKAPEKAAHATEVLTERGYTAYIWLLKKN